MNIIKQIIGPLIYLTIIGLNFLLLKIGSVIQFDNLDILLGSSFMDDIVEGLKIWGVTILSIIVIGSFVYILDKRYDRLFLYKLLFTIVFCFGISSPLYLKFYKTFKTKKQDKQRQAVLLKIDLHSASNTLVGKDLSYKEYQYIRGIDDWFEEVPLSAKSIDYQYWRDSGFTGDFNFKLSYSTPIDEEIFTFEKKQEHHSYESRIFKVVGNEKRVTYEKGAM